MRTTFVVITIISVVPFFVFRTTKTFRGNSVRRPLKSTLRDQRVRLARLRIRRRAMC
jgi:hypothetical protein